MGSPLTYDQQTDLIKELQETNLRLERELAEYHRNGPPSGYVNCRDQYLKASQLIL